MNSVLLQFIVTILAGWVHRGQQQVVDYLIEENRVLREQLGKKRLRLTNEQRRRLAVKAKALGRSALHGIACIVTPDTLLRWYRNLVAKKYDGSMAQGFVNLNGQVFGLACHTLVEAVGKHRDEELDGERGRHVWLRLPMSPAL